MFLCSVYINPLIEILNAIFLGYHLVWLERNPRIFRDQFLPVEIMWEKIIFLASLWMKAFGF